MDLETIAFGYGLIEGPRVDDEGGLYWSDVIGGGVYRRAANGDIATVVPRRRGVGGIALHAEGGIVISGRSVCHVRDGSTRVLFESEDIPGFNDLTTDARGRVLVGSVRSDPFAEGERIPGEVWRIDQMGESTTLFEDVGLPNGMGFSPDGSLLYSSDSARGVILVHDVSAEGAVDGRRTFATLEQGAPDGLAVDEAGGVWVACFGGGCVLRFEATGELALVMDVPARSVTSLCLGGDDRRDLYVVTADNTEAPERRGTIFRGRVDIPGLEVGPARI